MTELSNAQQQLLRDNDARAEKLAAERFHVGDEVTLDGASCWIVIGRERTDPTTGNVTYEISTLNGDRAVAQERYLDLVGPGPYRSLR